MHFIASFVSDVRADQTNSSILYVRRSIQFKHFFFIFRFCFTFTFLYVRSMQQRTTKSCFVHLSNYIHGALLAITSFPLGTHHRAYNGNDSFFSMQLHYQGSSFLLPPRRMLIQFQLQKKVKTNRKNYFTTLYARQYIKRSVRIATVSSVQV